MAAKILPNQFKKLIVKHVSPKFHDAVKIVETEMPKPSTGQILIKNKYVGINASDINFTAGRYDPRVKVPFDCGFEGMGQIVSVGPGSNLYKPGQIVGYMTMGAFAEYILINEKAAFPFPSDKPEFVALIVSGLTAALALDKVGEMKANDTVLVTAAAGGTGQFAVQLAKTAGCHVIGTCSSKEKADFLKSIGCDRAINYNEESLNEVLQKEYPKGVNVVYESVGGKTFQTCLDNLATKGRIIIIGFISGYEGESFGSPLEITSAAMVTKLLVKSLSLRGFMLNNFQSDFVEYAAKLALLVQEGKLKPSVDLGKSSPGGAFKGIADIERAVDYLYSRKNIGKILVQFDEGSQL